MAGIILLLLIILWILGYLSVPGLTVPRFPLFYLGVHPVTLWDILVFILILWIAGIAPSPFREIFWAAVVLWLLTVVGILVITGFQTLLVLAVIIGVAMSLLHGSL